MILYYYRYYYCTIQYCTVCTTVVCCDNDRTTEHNQNIEISEKLCICRAIASSQDVISETQQPEN